VLTIHTQTQCNKQKVAARNGTKRKRSGKEQKTSALIVKKKRKTKQNHLTPVVVKLLKKILPDDPLMLINWNDAGLGAAAAVNAAHTRAVLVQLLINAGAVDENNAHLYFTFRNLTAFMVAQRAMPAWSTSPGPLRCMAMGVAVVPPPVATVQLATKINKKGPLNSEVIEFPFFQTI